MSRQGLARATDAATSHAAAKRAPVFTHEHAIEYALWRPMIAPEIAKCTKLSIEQVCRRLPYMDKVELSGVERQGYREWKRIIK